MDPLDFLKNEPLRNRVLQADFLATPKSPFDKQVFTVSLYLIGAVFGLLGGLFYTFLLGGIYFNDGWQELPDALFYPPLLVGPLAVVGCMYLVRRRRAIGATRLTIWWTSRR